MATSVVAPDSAHAAFHRDEHGGLAPVVLEQFARVHPATRTGGVQALSAGAGVQFGQGSLPPGQDVRAVDDRRYAGRPGGRDAPVLD